MYQYYIYGLGIHTEIKLYDLKEREVAADVLVHYGVVSDDIAEYTKQGLTSIMSPTRVWFRNSIGHFVVCDGNDILVQPFGDVDEIKLASFVLGWCLAFLFQMRGFSAIHSSAIEIDKQAVLISGTSGAGKSTVALSLIDAGYRYLVDDIAMVNPKDDMLIQPGFPQQKICRNIAEQLEEDKLLYINEKKDKFARYNNQDFCDEPRNFTTMFILEKYDGDRVLVEEVTGIKKLTNILKNLFLLDAYKAMGFTLEEKERCLELAGKIAIYTIYRPDGKDSVREIRDAIIRLVKK